MFSLILILFKFIINNSSNISNISIINSFVYNLFNLSLNLSSLEKKSRLINTKRYCLIYDDTLQICLECEKNYIFIYYLIFPFLTGILCFISSSSKSNLGLTTISSSFSSFLG